MSFVFESMDVHDPSVTRVLVAKPPSYGLKFVESTIARKTLPSPDGVLPASSV